MLKSIVGAMGLMLGLAAPTALLADAQNQQNQNGFVIPRDSVAFGKTYGQWAGLAAMVPVDPGEQASFVRCPRLGLQHWAKGA